MTMQRKKVYLHVEIERNHQKEFASMIAAILGIIISFFDMYARTLPFEVSLFALGLIVVGFVGSFYYSHKKGQFERQLLALQFSVKCPSCKNPIPEGN